jgi:hypothetical protein
MRKCRRARGVLVVAFLALVAVSSALGANAQLSIFWRSSVVSWDDPTTQFQDALAVQGIIYFDSARQLREHTAAASVPSGWLGVPRDPIAGDAVGVTSRLTRSPPA